MTRSAPRVPRLKPRRECAPRHSVQCLARIPVFHCFSLTFVCAIPVMKRPPSHKSTSPRYNPGFSARSLNVKTLDALAGTWIANVKLLLLSIGTCMLDFGLGSITRYRKSRQVVLRNIYVRKRQDLSWPLVRNRDIQFEDLAHYHIS